MHVSVWDQRGHWTRDERSAWTSTPLESVLCGDHWMTGEHRLCKALYKEVLMSWPICYMFSPTHKDLMFIADDSTCSVSLAYLGRSSVGWVLVAGKITNMRSYRTSESNVIGTWRKIYQMIAKYYPWPVNPIDNFGPWEIWKEWI